jgi:hypothetical protein
MAARRSGGAAFSSFDIPGSSRDFFWVLRHRIACANASRAREQRLLGCSLERYRRGFDRNRKRLKSRVFTGDSWGLFKTYRKKVQMDLRFSNSVFASLDDARQRDEAVQNPLPQSESASVIPFAPSQVRAAARKSAERAAVIERILTRVRMF